MLCAIARREYSAASRSPEPAASVQMTTKGGEQVTDRPQLPVPGGVSPVFEDYLTAVFKSEEWDDPATTSDLSSLLRVTPSTVSATLKRLSREDYIDYEPYGRFSLTESGRAIAVGVLRRRRIIETYLAQELGLSPDEVHGEADLLEHAVSPRVLERMSAAVGNPSFDPHGDPIPGPDGQMPAPVEETSVPLLQLSVGESATVTRIRDSDPAVVRYLTGRGITVSAELRMIATAPSIGTVTVEVDGTQRDLPEPVSAAVRVRPHR